MAVRVGRAQMRDAKGFFQRARAAYQFSKNGLHTAIGQRTVIMLGGAGENLTLADRVVSSLAVSFFDLADLMGQLRALIHLSDQLAVDAIDFRAQARNGSVARLRLRSARLGLIFGHRVWPSWQRLISLADGGIGVQKAEAEFGTRTSRPDRSRPRSLKEM